MKSFTINDEKLVLVLNDMNIAIVGYTSEGEEILYDKDNTTELYARFDEGTEGDFSEKIESWLKQMIIDYNITNIMLYDNSIGKVIGECELEEGDSISDIIHTLWVSIVESD